MTTKRFKVLNGLLKYLETGTEGNNPTAPAGTPLRAYQEWKSGERNITYRRENDSLKEEMLDVAVNPFGDDFDAENKYIVPISKRANDFNSISAARAAANILDPVPTEATVVKGFQPARAIISVPDSTKNDPNAESQITKIKYDKKGRRNYTIPMGAASNTSKIKAVRAEILAAVRAIDNHRVTFKPEKI